MYQTIIFSFLKKYGIEQYEKLKNFQDKFSIEYKQTDINQKLKQLRKYKVYLSGEILRTLQSKSLTPNTELMKLEAQEKAYLKNFKELENSKIILQKARVEKEHTIIDINTNETFEDVIKGNHILIDRYLKNEQCKVKAFEDKYGKKILNDLRNFQTVETIGFIISDLTQKRQYLQKVIEYDKEKIPESLEDYLKKQKIRQSKYPFFIRNDIRLKRIYYSEQNVDLLELKRYEVNYRNRLEKLFNSRTILQIAEHEKNHEIINLKTNETFPDMLIGNLILIDRYLISEEIKAEKKKLKSNDIN